MKILVTGAAGFIGYHAAKRLAVQGESVIGIDNLNNYYDVALKYGRLAELGFTNLEDRPGPCIGPLQSSCYPNLLFVRMDLADAGALQALCAAECFDVIIHLAAQAGVRYSLINPDLYISSNIQGFLNILETVRWHPVRRLVYASSSSVYGLTRTVPFSETEAADRPASLYAATKRANELMAHSYAHLYGIPLTGLRFFTVYGPWGRPDMAPFLFTKAILERQPIDVFNYGDMSRDFTYIDDIVEGIVRVIRHIPQSRPFPGGIQSGSSTVPCGIYNIGNGSPVKLLDFIQSLEDELGIKAEKNLLPMQPGDVPVTWADCSRLKSDTGYSPHTDISTGIRQFIAWYRKFYKA
jgi:UDP-glucuronate 4-epimerase